MSTLLLRLAGPMQSWGTQSRFTERDTGSEPSKSGVIGLMCAALGKPREESPGDRPQLHELASLAIGVRVDHEGDLLMDYHTAGGAHRLGEQYGVAKANGSRPGPVVSRRYYLADAMFLVGLHGDDTLLRLLDEALAAPVWPLCLGRKSFVPSEPVRLPDVGPGSPWWEMSLTVALHTYPRLRNARGGVRSYRLRLVLESDAGPGDERRQDVPVDFAARRFGVRFVMTDWVDGPGKETSDVPLTAGVEHP